MSGWKFPQSRDHVFHGKWYEVVPILDQEPGAMDSNFVSLLPLSLNFPFLKMVVVVGRGGVTRRSLRSF